MPLFLLILVHIILLFYLFVCLFLLLLLLFLLLLFHLVLIFCFFCYLLVVFVCCSCCLYFSLCSCLGTVLLLSPFVLLLYFTKRGAFLTLSPGAKVELDQFDIFLIRHSVCFSASLLSIFMPALLNRDMRYVY